jgi:DNA-binding response OmpR family regulator
VSTVLVVEDDDALRGALRASLHARHLQALEAGTGEAALQIVARENPDVVLLDLGLPGIDVARAPERRVVRFEQLEIDLERRRVLLDARPVHLTPMEPALLELFVDSRGRLLSHEYLRARLREPDDDRQVSLRVHVRHLRQKLGDASAYPRVIGTEPGLGYRWLLDHGRQYAAD